MPDALVTALQELIKASPYAGMAILIIWIVNHYHHKQMKMDCEKSLKSIEEIRKAYSEITDKLPILYDQYMARHAELDKNSIKIPVKK